jgi:tetratricopeptide (TPR) repeat protein
MLRELLLCSVLVFATSATVAVAEVELPADVQSRLDTLPDDNTKAEYLQELATKSPADFAVQFHLGNTLFDLGKVAEAVTAYEAALKVDGQHVGSLVNLGSAYDELGRLDDALQVYRRALEIEPNEDRTLCNIGGVYFRKRQYEQALEHFDRALTVNPKSQLAHYNIAILFADSQIYNEAIREWEACVAIDPQSDLGQRSADNIEIIRQMMEAEVPTLEGSER